MADGESYIDWYGKGRKQNWRTPRGMFDVLNEEFGFTMDGASEPGNGLLPVASTADAPISWAGQRVFCNPPWSNIRPFIDLAVQAEVAVFLVPARTNVGWFHHALDLGATARFFKGRPSFELPEHTGKGHNSPVDCLLLVFSKEATTLATVKPPRDRRTRLRPDTEHKDCSHG